MKNIFLFLFVALALGVGVRAFFIDFDISLSFVFLLLLISFFLQGALGILSLLLGIFLLGFSISYSYKLPEIPEKPVFVECIVSSFPVSYYSRYKFSCKVLNSDYEKLNKREIFIISDYKPAFLSSFYAYGTLKEKYNKLYLKADYPFVREYPNKFLSFLLSIREGLIENFRSSTLNSHSFAIGSALIFGDRSYIDKETIKAFQDTGLIHLLAISGLHVGILFSILFFAFFRLSKKLAYGISSLFVLVFSLFASMHVPVIRASSVAVLYSYGKIRGYRVNFLEVLFFIAFVSTVLNPFVIFSVSFQLSFVAVLGIFLVWQRINFEFSNKFVDFLVKSYTTSIVASLFVVPLLLFYFGKFSISSIIFTTPSLLFLYPYVALEVINLLTGFFIKPLVNLMDFIGIGFVNFVKFVAGFGLKIENHFLNLYQLMFIYTSLFLALFIKMKDLYFFFVLLLIFLLTVSI